MSRWEWVNEWMNEWEYRKEEKEEWGGKVREEEGEKVSKKRN